MIENEPWVEFPALLQFLLPMYPRPRLRLDVVLVYRIFVRESPVDFTQIRIDLLASFLVDRAAD